MAATLSLLPCWRRRFGGLKHCDATGVQVPLETILWSGQWMSGSGPGQWMCIEAAASGCYVVAVLWGVVVALRCSGGDLVVQGQRAHRLGQCDPLVGLIAMSG